MNRSLIFFTFSALLSASLPCALFAADNSINPETRLREMLRSTMLQLRDAQNQVAALQTAQAESELKAKTLGEQVAAQAKQAAADKKTIDELNAKLTEQETSMGKVKETLEKLQQAYKNGEEVARAKESERAKIAADLILLQRRAADLQNKNVALFKIGSEILTRYEKFSLGEALSAKEPFVGLTRTRLENLVQGYQDKLIEQRAASPSGATASAQASQPKTAEQTSRP